MRSEILWLRSWGVEEFLEGSDTSIGKGILGRISKERIEVDFLKALLANTRKLSSPIITLSLVIDDIGFNLATSIYETSTDRPLTEKVLHDTIISAAMNAFDNASNASRARGGVKKCDDM